MATPSTQAIPAVAQLTWLLDRLGSGALAEEEVAEHFAPEYLTGYPSATLVPSDDVVVRVRGLAEELGPFTPQGFALPPEQTPGAVFGLLSTDTGPYVLNLTVEPAAPHRILDVLTLPLTLDVLAAPPPPPATWGEFDQRLTAYAPEASFLAVELLDDALQPIHALNADTALAIGSTYKLYILGELAHQITAGNASWDERLAIRDDWRSLPAAPVQDVMAYEPTGTEHTLREFAESMISVSGNTAADHLLFRLGRERVEASLASMGNEHAGENTPLLATRELFALDLALAPEHVSQYVHASEAERRVLLDEVVRPVDVAPAFQLDWVTPRNVETVGWFASTADLCRAMAALRAMAEHPGLEPVRDILALNPGINPALLDPQVWSYVGHNGGALPGGINRTWLLERADGRRFAMAATLNNREAPVDVLTPDIVLAGALTLLQQGEPPTGTPVATPPG